MTEPYFDLRDDLGEVSASMDVTAPEYLLFDKDGNGTLPRGNIITISAKYKQGKSFLCAIMCASVLSSSSAEFANAFRKNSNCFIIRLIR